MKIIEIAHALGLSIPAIAFSLLWPLVGYVTLHFYRKRRFPDKTPRFGVFLAVIVLLVSASHLIFSALMLADLRGETAVLSRVSEALVLREDFDTACRIDPAKLRPYELEYALGKLRGADVIWRDLSKTHSEHRLMANQSIPCNEVPTFDRALEDRQQMGFMTARIYLLGAMTLCLFVLFVATLLLAIQTVSGGPVKEIHPFFRKLWIR